MDSTRILVFTFVFVGAVIGVCLHEFGHALAAYYGGDTTVRDKGYLTLNPLRYMHPMLSFFLPLLFLVLGGIPLPGGAVYIETHRLRGRAWRSLVSLAGPMGTLAFTLLLSAPFLTGLAGEEPYRPVWAAWAWLIQVELAAFLLNLLPVPPLDGFHVLDPFLPRPWRKRMGELGGAPIFLLFLVFWQWPAANRLLWDTVDVLGLLLGVEPDLADEGLRLFFFWR